MATYIPNATQTTEPVESRTVESAALEFRTLKASINGRIEDVQDDLDAEIVNRIAGDAALQVTNNQQDVRIQAIESALLAIGEGGLPGTVYVQRLSGTGAQTAFALNVEPRTEALIDIFINGVYQQKDSFTVAGSLLTFSEAPPAGTNNIEVVISVTIANVETDASLVSYYPTEATVTPTTVESKLRESVSVKDFGAVGDGATDDTAAINSAPGYKRFTGGTFSLASSLKYQKDAVWGGAGKSFLGTIIKPSGDFPAFEPDAGVVIDYTKNTFSEFQIDATNVTSEYAFKIDNAYLTTYTNIWIRNSVNGISIVDSDALAFTGLMVMENSRGDAVTLGDNARAIKFVGCNFEKNPSETLPGATFRINGAGSTVSTAELFGCQFERGMLLVERGVVKMYGGKATSSSLVLYPRSRDSFLDDVSCYDTTTLYDFGMCNRITNARAINMDTPLHEYPDLIPAGSGSPVYGSAGDEYLYLVSAVRLDNAGTSAATIQIKEGSSVLATSPTFSLVASGVTVGKPLRDSYTFITCVKNTAAASGPVLTNCSFGAIRGGKNLLTNGTFVGGATTGWSLTSVVASASGDDVLLTPGSSDWKISQAVTSICVYGKRYVLVAKFSGGATVTLGDAAGGTVGRRPLYAGGVLDAQGDGDTLAMLAFQYLGQWGEISLGQLSSSSPVTVRWIALIEV